MEKEFDFKNIGKQMPYRTPDGFFDRMQEQVSARTKVEKHKKQLRMRLVIAATLAAAAMVLGLVFFPAGTPEAEQVSSNSLLVATGIDYSYSDAMDNFIAEMPDDELEEWVELSEYDMFMN